MCALGCSWSLATFCQEPSCRWFPRVLSVSVQGHLMDIMHAVFHFMPCPLLLENA
jgi:hypothetical protein